jgi:hypothetical protein
MTEKLVDAQILVAFLQHLGKSYQHTGTIYLVGGSSLLLVTSKASTFDIDLQFSIPVEYHAEFIECIHRISREMQIPIEQASPDEFIPLPAGYENRHRYIGRYGNLEVFHFDFYSVALGKLNRGTEKDFSDIAQMIQAGVIRLPELETYFQEILPKLDSFSLRSNASDLERKLGLFKKRIGG